jgi:hypothetical protein
MQYVIKLLATRTPFVLEFHVAHEYSGTLINTSSFSDKFSRAHRLQVIDFISTVKGFPFTLPFSKIASRR